MKEGYYYFKSLDNKSIDKSFGYISFTISADRHLLYFQCSLNKDKINNISHNRYPLELYLSPVTYITNTSLFLGKFSSFPKNRLFMDSSVSFLQSDLSTMFLLTHHFICFFSVLSFQFGFIINVKTMLFEYDRHNSMH